MTEKQVLLQELRDRLELIKRNCEKAIEHIDSNRLSHLAAISLPDMHIQRTIGQLQQIEQHRTQSSHDLSS